MVKNKMFFFGGYQGTRRADQSGDQHQLRADAGDAGRRLHDVCLAGLQRRPAGHPDGRLRRQPDRPVAAEHRWR